MSNKVEQFLNGVHPMRRGFLKGLLGTGALAVIALPASSVLMTTEASGKTGSAPPAGDAKKPDEKKPDEKKPDEKKPDEKKPDEKKPDKKKP